MPKHELITREELPRLVTSGVALLDVRAPCEFEGGSAPGAINVPLLDDEQRRRVGITYREEGQDAAIALGHRLIPTAARAERVDAWARAIRQHPGMALYCARGGLRSEIAVSWLAEAGVPARRVQGGYKALRRFLLGVLEATPSVFVLSGCTGVGKTETLHRVRFGIDLEGLANHRGSGFGRRVDEQPAQADFENRLARHLLDMQQRAPGRFVVEDESRRIGRIGLPEALRVALGQDPIVLQRGEREARISRIEREYTVEALNEFNQRQWPLEIVEEKRGSLPEALRTEEAPFIVYAASLLRSLDSIKKRLGGLEHGRLRAQMELALIEQARAVAHCHRGWIGELLKVYYDPMYTYQIENKRHRIVFEGGPDACREWLDEACAA